VAKTMSTRFFQAMALKHNSGGGGSCKALPGKGLRGAQEGKKFSRRGGFRAFRAARPVLTPAGDLLFLRLRVAR